MDGYAVRGADTVEIGRPFRLVGEAAAGSDRPMTVGPSEAVRIFTGGAIPNGADAVVIQENAETRARHGPVHRRGGAWDVRARGRPRLCGRLDRARRRQPARRAGAGPRRSHGPPLAARAATAPHRPARHRRRTALAGRDARRAARSPARTP